MKRVLPVIALVGLLGQVGFAVEPKVNVKVAASYPANMPVYINLSGTVSDSPVVIETAEKPLAAGSEDIEFLLFGSTKKPTLAILMPPAPGNYTFAVIATGKVKNEEGQEVRKSAYGFAKVKVGKVPPDPVPVPVPVPEPDPNPFPPNPFPPSPEPTPTPVPVPVPEPTPDNSTLRVLLLHETEKPMTRAQNLVWSSNWLVEYLRGVTVKDTKGEPGFRRYDPDVTIVDQAPEWAGMLQAVKDLLAKPGAPTLPVIAVFRGTHAKVYPFPDSNLGVMEVIKK